MLVTDGMATLWRGETEYRSKFGRCQSVTTLDVDVAFAPQYCQPVSRPDSRTPSMFQVGVPIASIKDRLGVPEVEKSDALTYLLPSETLAERVTFLHDGTRVTRIQWVWYFN